MSANFLFGIACGTYEGLNMMFYYVDFAVNLYCRHFDVQGTFHRDNKIDLIILECLLNNTFKSLIVKMHIADHCAFSTTHITCIFQSLCKLS